MTVKTENSDSWLVLAQETNTSSLKFEPKIALWHGQNLNYSWLTFSLLKEVILPSQESQKGKHDAR